MKSACIICCQDEQLSQAASRAVLAEDPEGQLISSEGRCCCGRPVLVLPGLLHSVTGAVRVPRPSDPHF